MNNEKQQNNKKNRNSKTDMNDRGEPKIEEKLSKSGKVV